MEQDKISKARRLRQVVEEVFELDIMSKKRRRDIVDARIVYAKILRQNGYRFMEIGKLLAKDHSTIMHYCSTFDDMFEFIPELKRKYKICLNSFSDERPIEYNYTRDELIKELLNTKKKLSLLHLKYEELTDYKNQKEIEMEKWGKIYKLIHEKTPAGMESVVERRINAMFNTRSYDYSKK